MVTGTDTDTETETEIEVGEARGEVGAGGGTVVPTGWVGATDVEGRLNELVGVEAVGAELE
jgi:hypothetical protein